LTQLRIIHARVAPASLKEMSSDNRAYRPCLLCAGHSGVEHYCQFGAHEYVRCGGCGLVYVDKLPTPAEMMGAYTGGGFRSLRRRLMAPFRKLRHHTGYAQSMERARQIFAFAHAALGQKHNAGLRFLDIGCNKGFLLCAALAHGADVYGIELVREIMIPFGNTYPRYRDHIYSEKLAAVADRIETGFFDLISAIDVVEHFEDPVSDMKHVHRMLKDGGVAVLQTPDAGCARAKQERCRWGALKPLEHLHLFDRANFVPFAGRVGFRDVRILDPFEEADGNFVAVLRK